MPCTPWPSCANRCRGTQGKGLRSIPFAARKQGRRRHGQHLFASSSVVTHASAPEREFQFSKEEYDDMLDGIIDELDSEERPGIVEASTHVSDEEPEIPRAVPRRARGAVRSGKRSNVVSAYSPPGMDTPATEYASPRDDESAHTPSEDRAAADAIEADAVFAPESDPATHVLPASYDAVPDNLPNSAMQYDLPPSFTHEPTQAPDPAGERPGFGSAPDPLDPDVIAATIADSSIYEEMYNEYGMGGEMFDSDEEPAAKAEGAAMAEEDAEAGDADRARRSEVLLELASAAPETLESLISKHRDSIDEKLLEQLYSRIAVAQQFDEGDDVVEGLIALFQRLRNEAERRQSTPAMRLLDDLLLIMDSDVGSSEAARLEAAAEHMETAFDPNGAGRGIDVFAVASALGHGDTAVVDDSIVEFVARPAFMEEVEALLGGAEERADVLRLEMEQKEATFQEGVEAHAYSAAEEREFRKELQEFRARFEHSLTSIRWCTAFLQHARGNKIGEDVGAPSEATARQR